HADGQVVAWGIVFPAAAAIVVAIGADAVEQVAVARFLIRQRLVGEHILWLQSTLVPTLGQDIERAGARPSRERIADVDDSPGRRECRGFSRGPGSVGSV